ncbi:MAG: TfoX/Sxy family protein [Caldilineaceae bacterium]|nr:TfoX/Sxy family protein [Caldilineaceae bacterium]
MSKESEYAFVEHILDLLSPMGDVTVKRMFGGYGLFQEGRMFGLTSDSRLYLKTDAENRPAFAARGMEPFHFERKDKTVTTSYYEAPEEALEDEAEMMRWAESGRRAALRTAREKAGKGK